MLEQYVRTELDDRWEELAVEQRLKIKTSLATLTPIWCEYDMHFNENDLKQ